MSTPSAQSSRPTAIVIGGGLAGLGCAVELTTHGFEVTVIEKNNHLGGKMNVLEESGFRFDMGPTILTLPQVIRGIITRSGRRVEDLVELVRLDPQWRCFWEDGTRVDLRDGVDAMVRAVDSQFPNCGAGRGWRDFLTYSRRMFGLSEKVFFFKDLEGVLDLMRHSPTREPGLLGDVLRMRMHSTVAGTVHKHVREPHLAQLCEHFMQYVGSSPFLAPAILSLIAAAQSDHGCWYSMGGTRSIARALEGILRDEAVDIRLSCQVSRILQSQGRATGVEFADGRTLHADIVVSNCDVQRTYRDLIGGSMGRGVQRAIGSKYAPACSGVVFYLGIDRQYDHLLHHDFFFSADSRREFDEIYRQGIPARDPSIYLCVPSRTDPTQAPAGCEALYALIHTPALRPTHQWSGPGGLLEQYRPVVLEKLKRCGMPDLEERIVVERHLTPESIEQLYNAEGGAIYGLASHGRLHGGFKPRNRSRFLKNLYLAGGSTNPGAGVPMVLMSGVTAARCACEDLSIPLRGSVQAGNLSCDPALATT